MRNDTEGAPLQKPEPQMTSLNELTALIPLSPMGSRRTSKPISPYKTSPSSISLSFSNIVQEKYFFIAQGGMVASAFNIASVTFGAGTLAFPYAIYNSGVLLSILALVVCSLATVYSVYLLVRIMDMTGKFSYEKMANYCFGPAFEKITACIIVLFCWGVAVVYIVVIGDIIGSILIAVQSAPYIDRNVLVGLFWFFIMLPLSLARSINTLRYASLVSILSTLVLVAAVCTHALKNVVSLRVLPLNMEYKSLSTFTTFIFLTSCQPVVSKIYAEMRNRSVCRITTASALSITSCLCICFIVGVFGAAEFGPNTMPNIMQNYTHDLDKPYMVLAFLSIAVTVTMSFPMTIFPTREAVLSTMRCAVDEATYAPEIVGALLAFLALVLGLLVPNVRLLFDFLGGVLGSFVSLIFPSLFALRCGFWNPANVGWTHTVFTITLLLLGIVSSVLGFRSSLGIS